MQLADKTFLDPQEYGGVLVRANTKHGSEVNASVIVGIDERAWMLPLTSLTPGKELFWFYDSNGISKIPCACNGRAVSVPVHMIKGNVDLPKCRGFLNL